ncbi:MAG: type IX secretion system membrane protein PorP/SprF [Cyclobacteriaceae bacterium]
MKRLLTIFCCVFIANLAYAQNSFFFGHYMFNPTNLNPSWSGAENTGYVAFQHRSQWAGYATSFDGSGGAPNSQMLTLGVPVRNLPISSLGLNVVTETLGALTNFQALLPITYSRQLAKGNLHIGIAPGVFSQTQNFNLFRANDPNDDLIQGGREVQTKFNMSAGVLFQSKKNWFLGLGAVNLMQPGFDFGKSIENKQKISYSLIGGYTLSISEVLEIGPTILIRTNTVSSTFDLGGIMTLNQKMWVGLSYRKSESAIIYLGYKLLQDNRLSVGYSFDYVIQNRDAKAATSHELFLRYDLPDLVLGGRKRVVTPRFSF